VRLAPLYATSSLEIETVLSVSLTSNPPIPSYQECQTKKKQNAHGDKVPLELTGTGWEWGRRGETCPRARSVRHLPNSDYLLLPFT